MSARKFAEVIEGKMRPGGREWKESSDALLQAFSRAAYDADVNTARVRKSTAALEKSCKLLKEEAAKLK